MEEKQGLYQIIEQCIRVQECTLCTVLEGSLQGAKILFCGGEQVFSTVSEDSFTEEEKKYLLEAGSGIVQIRDFKVFCERFGAAGNLVICGAGHVSVPIIEIGKRIGFFVTVLDDRPLFADRARAAGADQVICDSFEKGMEQIAGGSETYIVIVTRGHRYDRYCLDQALKKDHAYVGMMGSKRRVALVKEQLKESGADPALLEQVHTPIGLSIGAETPEEIAVSILAEIIQVKNAKRRTAGYAGEILDELLKPDARKEAPVLAVIISRKGSAPRKVGTKMLIYRDGSTVGTIGGGCMESEVITRARRMFDEQEAQQQIMSLNMTGADAEDEGMVCGGIVEVYLERSVW